MPGSPVAGIIEGCVDEALTVLMGTEVAGEAPPERAAPMTYMTVSAMTVRRTKAARRGVVVEVMWL
jgi:hypothetical protein